MNGDKQTKFLSLVCLHRHSALLVADSTSVPRTGKLQPTGQIQLTTYFCAVFELRIVCLFVFLHFWMTEKTQKKTILWHMHIIWNLNLSVQSCIGTQPCSLVHMFYDCFHVTEEWLSQIVGMQRWHFLLFVFLQENFADPCLKIRFTKCTL